MKKKTKYQSRPGDYNAGRSVDSYGFSPAGMLGRLFGVQEEYPKPAQGKTDREIPKRKK